MNKFYLSSCCFRLLFAGLLLFISGGIRAQIKIGANGNNIAPASLLELESVNQGLLLPRLTDTTAINALDPPNGMLIYLTKEPAVGLYVRKVAGWEFITGSLGGNGSFNSLTVSGPVTAGSFSGPLNGNASSATTAVTATNSINSLIVNDLSTTAITYPTFVTTTPGNTGLRTSTTNLSYVPGTGVLTALGFRGPLVGDVTGIATQAVDAVNATNIAITNNITTDALHYPTFVAGTSGNQPQQTSSPNLTFNPNTGVLSATTFNGDLTGNSATATNASTTIITDDIATSAVTYPTFVTNTSGNWGQRTAGSKLTFVPSTGILSASGFTSTVPNGTAPFVVASSTTVPNLTSTNAVNTGVTNDLTTNSPVFPTFVTETAGFLDQRTSNSRLSFIPSTGQLSATSYLGAWNGGVIAGQYGGTGVANTGRTITLGGNLTTFGANNIILRTSNPTDVTLPASGILVAALSATGSVSFVSTPAGESSDGTTIAVPGAEDGDVVSLGIPANSMGSGGVYTAWVSGPGVVSIRFTNTTGGAVAPSTAVFNVKVFK